MATTIMVTTTNNLSPATGEVSLAQALQNAQSGDTIAFNIPGPGPQYIVTPSPAGYSPITGDNIIIDGYTQPGAVPNANPILAANNAKIKIFLDSREGGRTVLNFDGYGNSEAAILPVVGATNVTVRGLGFLARIADNTAEDPSIYCVAFGAKAMSGHVNGCWMGVDADGRSVFGANAGITGFRYRENGISFLVDNMVLGVEPNAIKPEAQFNVIAGMKIPIGIEGNNTRISGNFIGVLPNGTNEFNNTAAGLPNEGAIQIGRTDGGTIIGTDGDGVNDAAERNVFAGVTPKTVDPVNGYDHLIEFYGSGQRTNIVIAGNYIGVGIDGATRFTNGAPVISGLTATARIGSDFDAVSDTVEGNVIFNNFPASVFQGDVVVKDFLEDVSEDAIISLRGNKLVNNFTPPVSPLRDDGAFLTAYYSKAILDPESGIAPTLSDSTSVTRLIGTIPVADTNSYPLAVIDLYTADPEGMAAGQAEAVPQLPNGFVQGLIYLGSFFEGSAIDLDPAPGKFSFNIGALNIPVGTRLTITANYSQDRLGTHNAATLTTLFSNPVVAKEGSPISEPPGPLSVVVSGNSVRVTFTGVLQSAASIEGPWNDVSGAANPYTTPLDQRTRFFRARSL